MLLKPLSGPTPSAARSANAKATIETKHIHRKICTTSPPLAHERPFNIALQLQLISDIALVSFGRPHSPCNEIELRGLVAD
jgi:hypothetical protein